MTDYTNNYNFPYPEGGDAVAVHTDVERLAKTIDSNLHDIASLAQRDTLTPQDNVNLLQSQHSTGLYEVPLSGVAESLGLPEPAQGILRVYWIAGGTSHGATIQEWLPRGGKLWRRNVAAGISAVWSEWLPDQWVRANLTGEDNLDMLRFDYQAGMYPVPTSAVASDLGLPDRIQGALIVMPHRGKYATPSATQLWYPRNGRPYVRHVREVGEWTTWAGISLTTDFEDLENIYLSLDGAEQRYVTKERLAVTDGQIATVDQQVNAGRLSETNLHGTYATKQELSEVATGDPISVTDTTVAAAVASGESTRQAINNLSIPRDGGTVHGDLYLETPPNQRSTRIKLEAWERSNPGNNRAGDVLELHWRTPYAKPFIGWWDSTDPDNPVMKAWMGAHDLQNNPDPSVRPHRHWSIEVADEATGAMQTRLAIPYDQDHTNIKTASADFTVGWGALRVAAGPMEFTSRADADPADRRWSFSPAGGDDYDLQFRRHYDDGTPETVARFDRATGNLGIGGNHTAERVLHVQHAHAALLVEGTSSTTNAGLMVLRHAASDKNVLQAEVSGDTVSRFSLEASGSMSWGDGRTGRDITITPYSSGASQRQLRVEGADLRIMGQGRGIMLRDDNNPDDSYRVVIRDGELRLIKL